MRQLELENGILRAAAKIFKAESPSAMTNREKALVINELRATTGRSSRELTGSLRISKSSYEYQRAALCRPGKRAALRSGDDPVTVSEKVVRRIMREEGVFHNN